MYPASLITFKIDKMILLEWEIENITRNCPRTIICSKVTKQYNYDGGKLGPDNPQWYDKDHTKPRRYDAYNKENDSEIKKLACSGSTLWRKRSREKCTIWRLDKGNLQNQACKGIVGVIPFSVISIQWCPFISPRLPVCHFEKRKKICSRNFRLLGHGGGGTPKYLVRAYSDWGSHFIVENS